MKRIVLWVCCLVWAGQPGVEAAVIYMESGREIHTDTFYKEDGMVFYSVAGQAVGVPESAVVKIDESVDDSVLDERIITISMPRYYEVATTVPGAEGGLYEESLTAGTCPVFRQVFGAGVLQAEGCDTGFGSWVLAAVGASSSEVVPLATLRHVPKGQGPHYRGSHWTAENGRVCEVSVTPARTPAIMDGEKVVLKFNGFPNGFFNGLYKPWAMVNGRIAYKMTKAKDEATLELRSGGSHGAGYCWVIRFGNETYYRSALFDSPGARLPHEVTAWFPRGSSTALPRVEGEVDAQREHTFEFDDL